MAWLVGDGFDFYNVIGDAIANTQLWQTISQCVLSGGGRFGGSHFIQLGNNSVTAGNIFTTQFTNSNVIFVNANIISGGNAHVNGGTTQTIGFTLRDTSANIQCGFFLRNGGDFVLTSGGIGSAVLATSPVFMPLANIWAHIQVKITIHNTTGNVELRLNGNTVANWTATGLNTRNGTANFFANVIHWTSNSASGESVDDFYAFNDQGAQPNTFQGDVRAIQQFPTSDIAIQWTRNTGPNNCLAVDEPFNDGDTTYVATNTPGFTDIYALTPLAVTPSQIIAVQPRYNARHDDAGPHTVTAQFTSGGTTANFPNYNTTVTYAYQQTAFPQDPNTSAAWTAAAVNAILLSIIDVL
jgi:hypothetical protein